MASSKMIKLTGSTLERASWVFSFSALLMMTIPPSSFWIFDMYEVYKIYYITGPRAFCKQMVKLHKKAVLFLAFVQQVVYNGGAISALEVHHGLSQSGAVQRSGWNSAG